MKVTKRKAQSGKNYVCEICEKRIEGREEYYKIVELYRKPRIRCCNHKPKRYELTRSNYLSTIWRLQDEWNNEYDLKNGGVQDIISELEDLKGELENSLDDAISELECLDYECNDEFEEDGDTIPYENQEVLSYKSYGNTYLITYDGSKDIVDGVYVMKFGATNDFTKSINLEEPINVDELRKACEEGSELIDIDDIVGNYCDELDRYDDYVVDIDNMYSEVESILDGLEE